MYYLSVFDKKYFKYVCDTFWIEQNNSEQYEKYRLCRKS